VPVRPRVAVDRQVSAQAEPPSAWPLGLLVGPVPTDNLSCLINGPMIGKYMIGCPGRLVDGARVAGDVARNSWMQTFVAPLRGSVFQVPVHGQAIGPAVDDKLRKAIVKQPKAAWTISRKTPRIVSDGGRRRRRGSRALVPRLRGGALRGPED
jgi:hypothetical protein